MIIVGGCSFTDKNMPKSAIPDPLDFKMWPEHLADKTGKKVINTGRNGIGNERIFHEVVTEIFKHNNVEKVLVAWTEWTRQDFLAGHTWKTIVPKLKDMKDNYTDIPVYDFDYLQDWYKKSFGFEYPDIENVVNKNLNLFYSLYSICKVRNIDLKMFQMLYPISNYYYNDDMQDIFKKRAQKAIIANPLSLEVDESVFWGWPWTRELGGIELVRHLQKIGVYQTINHIDAHPNAETQKNIMEFIYNEIY